MWYYLLLLAPLQEQLKLFQRTVARLQSEVSVLASHQALGDTQRQELSVLRQQNECLAAMLDNMRMTTHALIERTRLTAAQVAGAAGLVGPAVKAAVFNGAIESVGAMQQQQPTVPEAAPACAASSTHASPAIADEPAGAPDCKVPTVNAVGGPTALSAHAGGSVGHGVGALPLDASVTGGANMTCADVNGSHAATSAKTLGSELGSKTSGA